MQLPPPHELAATAVVIFLAIGIHEYAHAKAADMAGDPTPRMYGRVTLDLTKHFELMGTIMIVLTTLSGIGIGWGKPVPMDPRKMRNPRWDHFTAVIAGPISNILQAGIWAIGFRLALSAGMIDLSSPAGLMGTTFLQSLLFLGVVINISLAIFNMIPLGPLDGMWIFGTFLPERQRYAWTRWNLTTGQFAFLALILLGQLGPVNILGNIILPPLTTLFRLLTGI
jgi:Zn-dependent protease